MSFIWSEDGDWSPRFTGLMVLAAAFLLGYLCVVQPCIEARKGAASVSTSFKMLCVLPLAFAFGAVYAAAPGWAVRTLGHPQHPTRAANVVGVILFILGLGVYVGVRWYLESMGYRFDGGRW
ncbi:MAG TPA: hypothetical protein VNC50_06680 [Planctomycetia bacterium]|nr:hypothetical protein [Planctomycetia bacterium]